MGLSYNKYIDKEPGKVYGCAKCKTHLAAVEAVIARSFQGQHGKAYLFETVCNVNEQRQEERNMTTGKHLVRDIHCRRCDQCVGWKYDKAYEEDQVYKEGKFILEYALLTKDLA
ncbi:yippee zinc-binding protein Moh1 [Protomyces lactucae-debilis]|uniref:Protein yippee-like n=1 Tax=Protomyces lactucae-debilis TaxID=2754530 RepID=A0A1Y2FGV6_PROLT|nr:yippee zinc-binding protein Moh1 [Protomyces lactucae-debilis]ORY82045.1 yippee zinc-binding protein Moh1 [Protomyces lactucae-debilis]